VSEDLREEKEARIYYQDIVYHVCNVLDKMDGKKPGLGIVCGTSKTPARNVQERMDKLLKGGEQQIPRAWWDRLREYFQQGINHPTAEIRSVCGSGKNYMDRIERGE
jgi:hypothetical protein